MWKTFLVLNLISFAFGLDDLSHLNKGHNNLPHIQNCNIPCSVKAIEPTCIFDGTKFHVYNDFCQLLKANCTTDYKLKKASIEECLQPSAKAFDVCDFPCPSMEKDICGKTENGSPQIFKSGCLMGKQSCKEKTKYYKVDLDMCKQQEIHQEECNIVCPSIYKPKCAFNGKEYTVFANDCDLDVANCFQLNLWSPVNMTTCNEILGYKLDLPNKKEIAEEKNDESDEVCPIVCKRVFWPLCAFDGKKYKIFANECLFKKEKCEKNPGWKKTKISECMTALN